MLIIAVAVSVGAEPTVPFDCARLNNVEQFWDEVMQAERILASEFTASCGAEAVPAGIIAKACPVAIDARSPAELCSGHPAGQKGFGSLEYVSAIGLT
jgi:hypothetical protein